MTSYSARFFEVFNRIHLKSDAMPKPPRNKHNGPDSVTIDDLSDNEENVNTYEQEDTNIELDDLATGSTKSRKKEKSKSKTPKAKLPEPYNTYVNTQATGNVYTVLNSNRVHIGNVTVINAAMPAAHTTKSQQDSTSAHFETQANIKKDPIITLVMEAEIKAQHQYLDYVAKNLGKDWESFFRSLGYGQGLIETMVMENGSITEARYKLLLDWARNDKKGGTLGHLSTLLWEEGQRQIVKVLGVMYKQNLKKNNAL